MCSICATILSLYITLNTFLLLTNIGLFELQTSIKISFSLDMLTKAVTSVPLTEQV